MQSGLSVRPAQTGSSRRRGKQAAEWDEDEETEEKEEKRRRKRRRKEARQKTMEVWSSDAAEFEDVALAAHL